MTWLRKPQGNNYSDTVSVCRPVSHLAKKATRTATYRHVPSLSICYSYAYVSYASFSSLANFWEEDQIQISHQAPTCLADHLHLYTPSQQLHCSADTWAFRIPPFHTGSSGQHSFSDHAAPTSKSKLPVSARHATSVSSFRSSWKTFFQKPFLQSHYPGIWKWERERASVYVCVCVEWGGVLNLCCQYMYAQEDQYGSGTIWTIIVIVTIV